MTRVLSGLIIALLTFAAAQACELHDHDVLAKRAGSSLRAPSDDDKALSPYWIGPGQSGSWFNPARAGEGWILEMLADGTAAVVWFTYAPQGSANPQAWILGQGGVVEGNRIRFTQVFTARGGRFGPNFDPSQVVLEPWGSLDFTFDSCGTGSMSYSGPAAYGAGSQPMTRLTTLRELDCAGTRALTPGGARAAKALRSFAGSWVDPAHAGEGWLIEPLSETQAGIYWFTYTPDGQPAWFLGLGTVDGDRLRFDNLLRPVGTAFGSSFDPNQVQLAPWGTLEFAFGNCGTASVTYTSTQSGFGNGTLAAQRLTSLASSPCLDALPQAQLNGTWSQGSGQPLRTSEVASAELDGKIYSAGGLTGQAHFERYDAVGNAWEVLPSLPNGRDHALMVGYQGGIYIFGGYPGAGSEREVTAWRYDVAARTFQTLNGFPHVAASGAAVLNGYFYLGSVEGDLFQVDPRTSAWRRIPAPNFTERDHSQVVAYLGELWLVGGRSAQTGEQTLVTIFDPVSETWRNAPRLRGARSGFAAAVVNHQIMASGGEFVYSGRNVVRTFEAIGPGSDSWAFGPPPPTPVHGVAGAVFGGRFYAVGGSVTAGIADNPGIIQIYTPAQ